MQSIQELSKQAHTIENELEALYKEFEATHNKTLISIIESKMYMLQDIRYNVAKLKNVVITSPETITFDNE